MPSPNYLTTSYYLILLYPLSHTLFSLSLSCTRIFFSSRVVCLSDLPFRLNWDLSFLNRDLLVPSRLPFFVVSPRFSLILPSLFPLSCSSLSSHLLLARSFGFDCFHLRHRLVTVSAFSFSEELMRRISSGPMSDYQAGRDI